MSTFHLIKKKMCTVCQGQHFAIQDHMFSVRTVCVTMQKQIDFIIHVGTNNLERGVWGKDQLQF